MNNKERKKEKKKMSKKVKIPLIIVGVIVVAFVGLLGSKFIMTWNDGMNMFTGESTDGGASMEANSSAPDVELDYEGMFSERDLEQEADLDEATTLTLVNCFCCGCFAGWNFGKGIPKICNEAHKGIP